MAVPFPVKVCARCEREQPVWATVLAEPLCGDCARKCLQWMTEGPSTNERWAYMTPEQRAWVEAWVEEHPTAVKDLCAR